MQDVVGDVDHIVDWAQTHGGKAVAEPLGAFGYVDALYGKAAVAYAGIVGFDCNLYGVAVGTVGGKHLNRGAHKARSFSADVAVEEGGQVAGHAVVRGCVDAVGCEVNFEHKVVAELIVVGGGSAGAAAPSGSTMMPSCDEPTPISSSAQIMPRLSTPRILPF